MLSLLLPTERATAAAESFSSVRPLDPVSPPRVAEVSEPKLSAPTVPVCVSNDAFCNASVLPSRSVPRSIRTLPP